MKFCGIDWATIQLGAFRSQTKLSKYGNARLRRPLWVAGQVAILQRTNSLRDKFGRYTSKDATTPIRADGPHSPRGRQRW